MQNSTEGNSSSDRHQFFRALEPNKADCYLLEKRDQGFSENLISEVERLITELFASEELLTQAKLFYFEELEAQEENAESSREDIKSLQNLLEESQTEKRMLQESISELEGINERLNQRMKLLLSKVEENEKEITDFNSALQQESERNIMLTREIERLKTSLKSGDSQANPREKNIEPAHSPITAYRAPVFEKLGTGKIPRQLVSQTSENESEKEKERILLKEELERMKFKMEMKEMTNKLLSSKVSEINATAGGLSKELQFLKKQNSTLFKENQALQNEKSFLEAAINVHKGTIGKENIKSKKDELIQLVRRRNTLQAFIGKIPKNSGNTKFKKESSIMKFFKREENTVPSAEDQMTGKSILQENTIIQSERQTPKDIKKKEGKFYWPWPTYFFLLFMVLLIWNIKLGYKITKNTALKCFDIGSKKKKN